ncbi:hypothetical protein H257_10917 [Aphanomyces astaci]|uniref:Uncharacterized protein n=1 Tax=Aphanomyces astaci TaxID=112090 RepID=W4G5U8_APHAT|nr:hypothetical protein H257_10917 [Aphanomyces astaci]ETV74308.1 hypothetical protein H257_10917 [Aphanomyces astaci]|eukprot:XP_009835966.1 hypothetical protein H257_10917 [Aphanomyces astaci]
MRMVDCCTISSNVVVQTPICIWRDHGKKHPLILVLKTTASKIKATVEENLSQRHGFGKQVGKQV